MFDQCAIFKCFWIFIVTANAGGGRNGSRQVRTSYPEMDHLANEKAKRGFEIPVH